MQRAGIAFDAEKGGDEMKSYKMQRVLAPWMKLVVAAMFLLTGCSDRQNSPVGEATLALTEDEVEAAWRDIIDL
jgi:hypothetical protein